MTTPIERAQPYVQEIEAHIVDVVQRAEKNDPGIGLQILMALGHVGGHTLADYGEAIYPFGRASRGDIRTFTGWAERAWKRRTGREIHEQTKKGAKA